MSDFNREDYEEVEAVAAGDCKGCVFLIDSITCMIENRADFRECTDNIDIIYHLKEPQDE